MISNPWICLIPTICWFKDAYVCQTSNESHFLKPQSLLIFKDMQLWSSMETFLLLLFIHCRWTQMEQSWHCLQIPDFVLRPKEFWQTSSSSSVVPSISLCFMYLLYLATWLCLIICTLTLQRMASVYQKENAKFNKR